MGFFLRRFSPLALMGPLFPFSLSRSFMMDPLRFLASIRFTWVRDTVQSIGHAPLGGGSACVLFALGGGYFNCGPEISRLSALTRSIIAIEGESRNASAGICYCLLRNKRNARLVTENEKK